MFEYYDKLSQDDAAMLVTKSLEDTLWGNTFDETLEILAHAHTRVFGHPDCSWLARWDINRWMCQHGQLFAHLPIRAKLGTERN